MKANLFCYAAMTAVALAPGWALAAEAGKDTMNRPTQIAPVEMSIERPSNNAPAVQQLKNPQVDIKQTTRRPNNLPKVEPDIKKSVAPSQPAEDSQAGSVGTIRTPPVDLGNRPGIQDAFQAREFEDIQGVSRPEFEPADLSSGGGGLTGPDGRPIDLTKVPGHGEGGFEDPDGLPGMRGNHDKTGRNPLIPSTNPADWMSGAASQSRGSGSRLPTYIDPNDSDRPPRHSIWQDDNRGGGSGVSEGGNDDRAIMTLHFRARDGSGTRTEELDRNGTRVGWSEKRTSNGRVTSIAHGTLNETTGDVDVVAIEYDSDGNITRKTRNEEAITFPQTGIDKTQDPDSDSEAGTAMARYLYGRGMLNLSPDSTRHPNRVNPGPEGATPNPKGPRLAVPEEQLVINPDPDNVSGGGAMPDARTAEMMRQQMLDKAQGVTTGGRTGGSSEAQVGASDASTN